MNCENCHKKESTRRKISKMLQVFVVALASVACFRPVASFWISTTTTSPTKLGWSPSTISRPFGVKGRSSSSSIVLSARRGRPKKDSNEDDFDEDTDWTPSNSDEEEDILLDEEDLSDVVVDDMVATVDEDSEDEEDGEDQDEMEDDDEDIAFEFEDELEEEDDEELVTGEYDELVEEDGFYEEGGADGYAYGEETSRSETVGDTDVEWDEERDGGDYPLEDDSSDPNYMRQKEILEEARAAAEQRAEDEAFDPFEFIPTLTEEQLTELDDSPFMREVNEQAEGLLLTEKDVEHINVEDIPNMKDITDLMDDDPYPRHEEGEVNVLEEDIGITDDDMEELDQAWKTLRKVQETPTWDRVSFKDNPETWAQLSNTTLQEMEDCLEEIGGSAYNVTRWLLYDLDFNVTNLLLAAVKHNRKAPILFQHWYPQLVTYERYKYARDRDFGFTWKDVEQADLRELERYYAGFGYDEIPTKAPGETGIISLEELDEEELRMAAFENWMNDVYNPEWDRKDFDDDDFRDEDNVFSDFYEDPQHPDLPTFEETVEDLDNWNEELVEENDGEELDEATKEYQEHMGRTFKYKVVEDPEFEKMFRGHLVVACTGADKDLEIAEKITLRMQEEFGKQVWVETRLMAHAREEDNVFEVWLESYDIELLHSKKRATSNAKGWDGPAECDEKQIDYLVERVGFMISDDARYSYSFECDYSSE